MGCNSAPGTIRLLLVKNTHQKQAANGRAAKPEAAGHGDGGNSTSIAAEEQLKTTG